MIRRACIKAETTSTWSAPRSKASGRACTVEQVGRQTKEAALGDLDTSLRELGTDHLDIWYLHAKTAPADVTDELIEAQQIAKKAGKIRFASVSTHSGQAELIPALAANPHIDVITTTTSA